MHRKERRVQARYSRNFLENNGRSFLDFFNNKENPEFEYVYVYVYYAVYIVCAHIYIPTNLYLDI